LVICHDLLSPTTTAPRLCNFWNDGLDHILRMRRGGKLLFVNRLPGVFIFTIRNHVSAARSAIDIGVNRSRRRDIFLTQCPGGH
jgi:hypothetical protein